MKEKVSEEQLRALSKAYRLNKAEISILRNGSKDGLSYEQLELLASAKLQLESRKLLRYMLPQQELAVLQDMFQHKTYTEAQVHALFYASSCQLSAEQLSYLGDERLSSRKMSIITECFKYGVTMDEIDYHTNDKMFSEDRILDGLRYRNMKDTMMMESILNPELSNAVYEAWKAEREQRSQRRQQRAQNRCR